MFASVPMDLVTLFPTGRFGVVGQAVGLAEVCRTSCPARWAQPCPVGG